MQGILCTKHSIGYLPLPKVANTSIKHTMFELEHGERFTQAATGAAHIHQYFRCHKAAVSEGKFRFVVVRDPIKRFLSAYANRVVHHRELSAENIQALAIQKKKLKIKPGKIKPDPSPGEFVDMLEQYQRIPSILVHTRPVAPVVQDLALFSKVYPFEGLAELESDLSGIVGKPVKLRHAQTGGPKLDVSCLSAGQLEKLRLFFEEDYRLLHAFYPFERIQREWNEKRGN
ncbi:MAG: sulfotransferase family 2 domain-containing protein [Luteolibacter sp.]